MLEKIGSKENIPKFLEGVKAKKNKLMGFGHRIYKNYDPRAAIIKRIAYEVCMPLACIVSFLFFFISMIWGISISDVKFFFETSKFPQSQVWLSGLAVQIPRPTKSA